MTSTDMNANGTHIIVANLSRENFGIQFDVDELWKKSALFHLPTIFVMSPLGVILGNASQYRSDQSEHIFCSVSEDAALAPSLFVTQKFGATFSDFPNILKYMDKMKVRGTEVAGHTLLVSLAERLLCTYSQTQMSQYRTWHYILSIERVQFCLHAYLQHSLVARSRSSCAHLPS